MNDIQEARFVSQEMLPQGNYQGGRLTSGVAQHLQRSMPSLMLPPVLNVDVRVESVDALTTFCRSLSKKPRIQEIHWKSPLPISWLTAFVDTWTPSQLAVFHLHLDNDIGDHDDHGASSSSSAEQISKLMAHVARIPTSELHITLGPSWSDIEPLLQGLKTARRSINHSQQHYQQQQQQQQPRISFTMAYPPNNNHGLWNKLAGQVAAHHSVRNLTVRGGVWGPAAWSGLVSCLQTSSLRCLTLQRVTFQDGRRGVPPTAVYELQQALYKTRLQELCFIDVQGSSSSSSRNGLALIQTVLASLVSHKEDFPDHHHHSYYNLYGSSSSFLEQTYNNNNNNGVCMLQSLTLKAQLSDVLDDDYACALHACLAQHLPNMHHLRTLCTRWHPATSALLWQAIQANTSLTWIDSGKAVGRMLEPVLQRNRLLRTTRHFGQAARTLPQVVEFAARHGLTYAHTDDNDSMDALVIVGGVTQAAAAAIACDETITASAAYLLVRSCLPHNIKQCCAATSVEEEDVPMTSYATYEMILDE